MSEHIVDSDFKNISITTHNKLSASLTKVGYSDGASAGRDFGFQKGFDQGYSDGLQLGFQISAIKSLAHSIHINKEYFKELDLLKEAQKYTEALFDKEYEENLKSLSSNVQASKEILEQQNVNINKLLNKLKANFPLMCSFINNK